MTTRFEEENQAIQERIAEALELIAEILTDIHNQTVDIKDVAAEFGIAEGFLTRKEEEEIREEKEG